MLKTHNKILYATKKKNIDELNSNNAVWNGRKNSVFFLS